MNFPVILKPPTSGDKREEYRWFYQVCEILNGLRAIFLEHDKTQGLILSDDTATDDTGYKHVTDAQVKKYEDHRLLLSDDTDTNSTTPANVTNAQVKKYEDHRLITDGNPHGTDWDMLENTASHVPLNLSPTSVPATEGTFSWDQTSACAKVQMANGVALQVGEEEYYPLVINQTASPLTNGTLVGFGGIDGGIEVTPYIADGSFQPWYIAGVTTEDIAIGELGRVSKFGYVHDINTTGSLYSETWASGDILYAHPTIAGGFTKVKPTAPNLMIPVAVVKTVDTTTGILLVRVIPQQRLYYGVFSDSNTQNATLADTIYAITMDTTDIASGFSRGTPTSRIVAANSGLYNFQFSVQLRSGNSASRDVFFWPRISGNDVVNSTSQWTIKSNTEVFVPSWNFVLSLEAGEYFELMWAASGTGVSIGASAAQTSPYARPAIPSIILTVTQANQ